MANRQRPLTSKQAWRIFEDAISNTNDIEEAYEWLLDNPDVARKMTGAGLLACFEEDISTKNKY
jgi:hypothetical protein